MSTCHSVSSSRYDAQGGIEVISPANSPALREEKNEGPFASEKSSGETSNPWCHSQELECLLCEDGVNLVVKYYRNTSRLYFTKKGGGNCIYLKINLKLEPLRFFSIVTRISWQKNAYLLSALIFCCVGLRFDINRFRQSGDSGPSAPQQPPSSQADSYGPVPKTHRIMTLADHISVSHTHTLDALSRHSSVIVLTFSLCLAAYHYARLCQEPRSSPIIQLAAFLFILLLALLHFPELWCGRCCRSS